MPSGCCSSSPSTTRWRTTTRSRTALEPLRAKGMRLAIDDVGAGFSSLRHIVLTKPDVIKLDRVDRGRSRPTTTCSRRSCTPSWSSATAAGAAVVAEGVETAADAETLRTHGVDYGQGWHFGRPGPASDLAPAVALPTAVRR